MSQLYVTKRDGRLVEFNSEKIKNAVKRAFVAKDGEVSEYAEEKSANIADFIESKASKSTSPLSVEEIQDLVVHGLMSTKRKDVAEAYILYRDARRRERMKNTDLFKKVQEKLTASNVQNQNANVDERSFGGRMGEANSTVMKQIALDYILSDKAKTNHLLNRIYIHDLDHYAVGDHNCLTLPIDDLLARGFNTRQTDVRPANSIGTACQLIAVLFQLQSLMQFGGVSAGHLDWSLIPYVRKSFAKHYEDGLKYILNMEIDDEMRVMWKDGAASIEDAFIYEYPQAYRYAMAQTERELKQSVEGMYHNLK